MPDMLQTYFIQTFGCQQNIADSERISSYYIARGYTKAKSLKSASVAILNTCMIRQQAEDKVTGLVKNIASRKLKPKIVVTGCMVGMATRDETGKYLQALRKRMPEVDEFLPLEEVGFDYPALRNDVTHAWVPISNGCNNFCTFCVVPFTRGREISRPIKDILDEVKDLAKKGCKEITLLGQNVNSYGADLVKKDAKGFKLPSGRVVKPVLVKHLNRFRIPTIFPYLLEEVCKVKGIETVKFISSNPWDFSDELIEVIAKNPKIDRNLHIAVQSGDDQILKRMNRWYSSSEYLNLVNKIKAKVKGAQISTDIIVGFPSETKQQFQNTIKLARAANFAYAYVSKYSARPNTAATKALKDNVPYAEKEKRFFALDQIINHKGTIRSAVH